MSICIAQADKADRVWQLTIRIFNRIRKAKRVDGGKRRLLNADYPRTPLLKLS